MFAKKSSAELTHVPGLFFKALDFSIFKGKNLIQQINV